MACKHKVGRITFEMALSGIQDELICSKCGRKIRLTLHSEWVKCFLFFATVILGFGVGRISSLCIPSDVPLVVFYFVSIPTALVLEWCVLAVYMRFFAHFEEVPEEQAPSTSVCNEETDMPCRHKVDRFTLGVMTANIHTKFVCCKCGRKVQLTLPSLWIKNILFGVIMVAGGVGGIYFALYTHLEERPVLACMFICAIAIILTWCIMAVYMKFFARFKEVPEERKPINISLRDDS